MSANVIFFGIRGRADLAIAFSIHRIRHNIRVLVGVFLVQTEVIRSFSVS
jgi:hypothetical protein